MKEVRAVNDREKRFCDEYLIDGNAIQAATRAGYAPGTARYASKWINEENLQKPTSKFKPELREYIDDHMKEIHTDKIASAEEVLEFLSGVMRNRKEETRNRIKAGELMGKRHGLFKDTISVQGAIPIVIDGGDNLED